MRREMLEALKALSVGSIKKAKMNIEVYLANPVGIGEHPDVLGAIQDQITEQTNNDRIIALINSLRELYKPTVNLKLVDQLVSNLQ